MLPRLTVTLAAAAILLTPTLAHAGPEAREPGDTLTIPASAALSALPIRDEDRTGYHRDLFKHWTDADRDGCNTRAELLLAEAVIAPARTGKCTLTGGQWHSPYDDRTLDGPRGLDIDHLVPLAEAWDSGASQWSAGEREAYANDLGDARDLIAVSAASNRSKGDQDPATWLPPATGYRCQYVTDWIADKTRWKLSADKAEVTALQHLLDGCPDTVLTVQRAR